MYPWMHWLKICLAIAAKLSVMVSWLNGNMKLWVVLFLSGTFEANQGIIQVLGLQDQLMPSNFDKV
jgi:hypothetical protein